MTNNPESGGLVHHWVQGPQDVRRITTESPDPLPVTLALAELIKTGHLVMASSFNYDTALYEAFVPNLGGNLTEIRPNSVLILRLSQPLTVVVNGRAFPVTANTPTPVPVGSSVSISLPGIPAPGFRWEFRWWLESPPSIPGFSTEDILKKVAFILDGAPLSWGVKTGVRFRQVQTMDEADIVLRITVGPPPGLPRFTGPGWYYFDPNIQKAVAQVTDQPFYWEHPWIMNYILGMELVGHGCFRMWDMYIPEHEPYLRGSMGGFTAAEAAQGWPSDLEAWCGNEWLGGRAKHIDWHQ